MASIQLLLNQLSTLPRSNHIDLVDNGPLGLYFNANSTWNSFSTAIVSGNQTTCLQTIGVTMNN